MATVALFPLPQEAFGVTDVVHRRKRKPPKEARLVPQHEEAVNLDPRERDLRIPILLMGSPGWDSWERHTQTQPSTCRLLTVLEDGWG